MQTSIVKQADEWMRTVKKAKWLGIYSYNTIDARYSCPVVHVECAFAIIHNDNTVEFRTFEKDSPYVVRLIAKMDW